MTALATKKREVKMKIIEHVKQLLKQGRKPKELIEFGFEKRTVTIAQRQLRKEKKASPPKTQKGEIRESQSQSAPPTETALVPPEPGSLEGRIQQLESRVKTLEEFGADTEELETRIYDTPALGLKQCFKCDCGASGFVALHVQCTKCGKEALWGWFPDK
jgi:hypothetical protein